MKVLPITVRELITALNAEFPHRCLRPGESLEDAARYAGKREVVDYLNTLLERTEKTGPERKLLE